MFPLFSSNEFQELLKSGKRAPLLDLFANPNGEKERIHIESILAKLPVQSYQAEIRRKLLSLQREHYLGAWYELMVFDWLTSLGKEPKIQPQAPSGGTKLDFLVLSNSGRIYIDVTSVQASRQDWEDLQKSSGDVSTLKVFKRLRGCLIKKLNQHKIAYDAYVICIGLESQLLTANDVKTCLFGNEVIHLVSKTVGIDREGELYVNYGDGSFLAKHKTLGGILVACHNDGSMDERYRLVFRFIQNPYSTNEVKNSEFGTVSSFVVTSRNEAHYKMEWIS